MAKEKIETMVEGGKATAAPPLGPALGPLKVNIAEVISAINKKTAAFKGMQVPIKVIVDKDTKAVEIEVGTPPTSALIKKEAGIEKGAGNPLTDKVADLRIEQIIKIAKMKEDNLLGVGMKKKIKEVIGTCNSMGVLVEGVPAVEAIQSVEDGVFDEEIKLEKTELTAQELKELEEEKNRLAAESAKRRADEEAKGKQIMEELKGKPTGEIKRKMVEAGISREIMDKLIATIVAAPGAAVGTGTTVAASSAQGGTASEKK
jgi:large subunit ribosomal protein L11